jgi:NADH-quinone oxidoreductase subunit H
VRLGPMRVGPHGVLQPIADAVKLMTKEDTIPGESDRAIFWMAPVISTFTALTAFAVVPFSETIFVADVNVGLLVISATSAVGILGIILGGWSSNSHYSLLGALRSAAQLVSYEVALALALLSGVLMTGTLSMVEIVRTQQEKGVWTVFDNFGLMIVPFFIYLVAAVAETNRAPFDLPEAESELVAGYHTEYSGIRWGLYFLAEYANMVVVSAVAVTLFWGGWLRPFPNVGMLEIPLNYGVPALVFIGTGLACFPMARRIPAPWWRLTMFGLGAFLMLAGAVFMIPAANAALNGIFWFMFKVFLLIYMMIWFRGTFPRYRYDQLMNIGWKYLIPLGMVILLVNAVVAMLR